MQGLVELHITHLGQLAQFLRIHQDKLAEHSRFETVIATVLQYGVTEDNIRNEVDVSLSTIHRWAKGQFAPHPALGKIAIERIAELPESKAQELHDAGIGGGFEAFVD